jgi:hypothetical protein
LFALFLCLRTTTGFLDGFIWFLILLDSENSPQQASRGLR